MDGFFKYVVLYMKTPHLGRIIVCPTEAVADSVMRNFNRQDLLAVKMLAKHVV
jgi:hypothetical protein